MAVAAGEPKIKNNFLCVYSIIIIIARHFNAGDWNRINLHSAVLPISSSTK